jgi:GNAT superfamily N-acetyltransferase
MAQMARSRQPIGTAEVPDFSMASTVHAVEANLFAFFEHVKHWSRVEWHDDAEYCWTISDLPFPLFNSVLGARMGSDRLDAAIDERIAACRRRGVPMLWWTGPSSEPRELGQHLIERGFFREPAYGMALDLAAAPAAVLPRSSAQISEVADRASLDAWTRVLCTAFGAPQPFGDAFAELAWMIGVGETSPFRHFLASVDGEPAATCSLFFGAGVAGIYDVSTTKARRRRGLGRLITQVALDEARAAGCRTAILHASSLGFGVYQSLGFQEICPIGQYIWAPALEP